MEGLGKFSQLKYCHFFLLENEKCLESTQAADVNKK